MTQTVPYSAFFELQDKFHYKVGSFHEHSRLNFLLESLNEQRRFALLNCLTPVQVEIQPGISLGEFSELMLKEITAGKHHAKQNPLLARNMINWNRLGELAKKHPTVHDILSLLVEQPFTEFLQSFDAERARVRGESSAKLERQTSSGTHVFCPSQKQWLHEAIYHHQFCFSAVNMDEFQSFTAIGGDPHATLRQAADWLIRQNAPIKAYFHQFGVPIAIADYEDQRVQWKYDLKPNEKLGFTPLNTQDFYAISKTVSDEIGFNTNRKAYLENDLGL